MKDHPLRPQFNAWVQANTGTMFAPGNPESSDFYFMIWLEGRRAGIEWATKVTQSLIPKNDT